MEFLEWLLPGALIGWTASLLMRRESLAQIVFNSGVGIAGAIFGSWLLAPLLGVPGVPGAAGVATVQMAILGAILSLAAVNLFVPVHVLRRSVRELADRGRSGEHRQAARG
jgi:uncharacterized membrane protein YeaQ/YmgE (transglycosylase-associated protein family)